MTLYAFAPVLMIVKKYESVPSSVPAEGSAPPCQITLVQTLVPSICNPVNLYAVPPMSDITAHVKDSLEFKKLFNVFEPSPLKLRVKSPLAFVSK